MNHRAKFDAAKLTLAGVIRNRTNTHTHLHTQTHTKQTVNNTSTRCLSVCVDNKDVENMCIIFRWVV